MAVERGELAPVEVPPEWSAAACCRDRAAAGGWSPHLQHGARQEPPRDAAGAGLWTQRSGCCFAARFGRGLIVSRPSMRASSRTSSRVSSCRPDRRPSRHCGRGSGPRRAALDRFPAFEGIRLETLRRSGAVAALREVLAGLPPPAEPALAILVMRARLAVGDREAGCALAREAIRSRAKLPASFRRDAVLSAGYCAFAGGNGEAAKLTADLIRGEKIDAPFALAVFEGADARGKPSPPLPKQVSALDYRIGRLRASFGRASC